MGSRKASEDFEIASRHRADGRRRVSVIGRGERLAKALELGFETVDSATSDPVETVQGMTVGTGPVATPDCAGVLDSYR
jgi:hypothetical protein